MKIHILIVIALVLCAFGRSHAYTQVHLERALCETLAPQDNFPDGLPVDNPLRYQDGLAKLRPVFQNSGWTTNQVIDALMLATTNDYSQSSWSDEEAEEISGRALSLLCLIDRPCVTNFCRMLNDDGCSHYRHVAIEPMIYHTNLEPDVLDYMKTLCVRTNIYDAVATGVMDVMFQTLKTLPDALKPAATNRVAKYMYFAIHHTTRQMAWQDRELAKFIPAYSNSVQRFSAMQHILSTATNARQRVRAQMEIDRMTQLGTNTLNNVPWIQNDSF